MVLRAVAGSSYIVDAHRTDGQAIRDRCLLVDLAGIAVEAITCPLILKKMPSFGLTWIAYVCTFRITALYLYPSSGTFDMIIEDS